MSVEVMFTSLPTVTTSELTDIICAVQGYVSSSDLGVSTQQTLQQVLNLASSTLIQYNAGDPNSSVAGTTYQFCWDTVDNILWVCTTSGTASTAVWTKSIQLTAGTGVTITQSGSTITINSTAVSGSFVVVTSTTQAMSVNTTYQANNVGLVTLTLPSTSAAGDRIQVTGYGSGGFLIAQNSGQNIQIGNISSTVGVGGSIASTNQFDGVTLICSLANTSWQVINGPEGNLTIV